MSHVFPTRFPNFTFLLDYSHHNIHLLFHYFVYTRTAEILQKITRQFLFHLLLCTPSTNSIPSLLSIKEGLKGKETLVVPSFIFLTSHHF